MPAADDTSMREPYAVNGLHDFYKVSVRVHDDVSTAFADGEPQIAAVPIPNGPHLQAYGRVRPSRVLRVVFHGAVRAGADQYPRFDRVTTMRRTEDSFLSIADPTLTIDPEITLAWYTGTSTWDPAPVIDELIRSAARRSGAEQVWLIGGSGGGLAALRHGRTVDNALVFAFSPQTDASRYRGGSFPRLMASGFGGMDADAAKAEHPGRFEVLSAYSESCTAAVYYMQNLTDPSHITDHYLPFLRAVDIPEASGDSPTARIRTVLVAQEREGHGPPSAAEFDMHLQRAVAFIDEKPDAAPEAGPGPRGLEEAEIRTALEELSEKLTEAIDTTTRTYRALNRQIGILPWTTETYHRLSQELIPSDRPLPPAGSFALRTAGIDELTRLLRESGAEAVVECGSGSSTVWMASQMERAGVDGHVYCLEHEPNYAQQTRDLLDRSGLSHRATVVDAPLEELSEPGSDRQRTWYSRAALEQLPSRIDLLFVDGPPTSVGRGVRAHALTELGSRLRVGALIAVDDIARPDEAAMVRSWLSLPQLQSRDGFTELAVLEKIASEGEVHE
ncbi:hypothetical protein C884_01314 [Kocuria palustris PEL]|uniref:Uncharacterized protein n=1 Tax=Kocuria palustris PEL TaxID=1236550 RepID=M2YAT8_9MICC|nr:class I SAM-dependent methyltransferase [Kocuria palustris]EME35764.1 hypothetical protein C884_01314 [Kocuria palustris PEL]